MRRDDFEIFFRRDAAPGKIALHAHDFYELYCPMDGQMDFIVQDCRYKLEPGSLLLIAPGELHRSDPLDPQAEFERVVLWLSRDFVNSLSTRLPSLVQTVSAENRRWNLIVPAEETGRVLRELLFSLLYEKNLSDADSMFMSRLIVLQLMVHLSRSLAHAPAVTPADRGMRYAATMKIYEFINLHYREEIGVSSLAERFYMDKNTLTRQFKRIIGLTPGEYIRKKRLENARSLILNGAGAQDAGYRSGFSDYSAFYRAFRQEYGVTPGALAGQKKQAEAESDGK